MNNSKIIIIGAGLSGLVTAYLLQKKGIEVLVLEANITIGGRIQTLVETNGTSIEMGATWFGKQHPNLLEFLAELDLDYFKQHTKGTSLFETMSFVPPQKFEIPDSDEPSYRLVGGTSSLIEKLAASIGLENIKTDTKICTIRENGDQIEAKDSLENSYFAQKVIVTLPPNLAVNTIVYHPQLPQPLLNLAQNTHTWMGESIKFALAYTTPFWREKQYSGALFSHVGIITEMYDHCTFDTKGFALKGFLNGGTNVLSKEERQSKVIQQLVQCFGKEAENYTAYHEKVWRDEALTFFPYEDLVMAHQNNGHDLYQKSFLNDKLHFAGSETATQNPGYMDGAIVAAQTISSKLK
ncbi:flavin monoamine oxidase family protein [Flavobacterium sp. 7A]|uniref:flavin monoamine oxidase family protein n=1 Tax=Flavobacterium sp. 7A TaxID=2940571 RepID=UPI0022268EC4|nr:NAD(P)/FAD-dependent oxidoreductase [Flavobacterium sp. 7A]MCW2119150.1 monoamine oxidase [Flavobacterium sp. 7A]